MQEADERGRLKQEMKRGEIWYANFGKQPGCVQGKARPCVVIQNNTGNLHSTTVIVAPVTTKAKKWMPTHVETTVDDKGIVIGSTILLEQIQTIDKCQISNMVGQVGKATMEKVDNAIRTSLALNKEEIAVGGG